MKIFFDTEFTGLHKNTTLVSIGLVDEAGRSFYAELNDYDRSQTDDWFRKHVEKYLIFDTNGELKDWYKNKIGKETRIAEAMYYGTKKDIGNFLRGWLSKYDKVELVSDVCHYDMVLFIDIFGGAFDIPSNVSPTCHDINADIAGWFGVDEKVAFDLNREDVLKRLSSERSSLDKAPLKHNSIWDAIVIRGIYQGIEWRVAQQYMKGAMRDI